MKYPVSMTAFGRGEYGDKVHGWTVEVRSVNHRFADIRIKMPRQYNVLEERIKKEVNDFYSRGHIEILVNPPIAYTEEKKTLAVNLTLVRQYRDCLQEIKSTLSLPASESELELLANYPNVIYASEEKEDLDQVWVIINNTLQQALTIAQEMREREGLSLKKDLLARLGNLLDTKELIEKKIPDIVQKKHTALTERVNKLVADVAVDPARLAQEIAIIADKSDVTEELVRFTSHIDQFRHLLEKQEPVGRRLDFLLQELLREVNTLASKISDADIAHMTVELKNEVEKMREQVQNLE